MPSSIETAIRNTVAKGVEAIGALNRKRLADCDSPFLTGIHKPMESEIEITDLSVTGTIPAALDGRYLRIGPNPAEPDPAGYHWFIGDGMVHGLRLAGGKALWYRNRWIRSNAVAAARGVEPAPGPRHIFDTVNTNVAQIGGRTWALVESGSYPVELSEDLGGQRYDAFGGTLQGSFTAHPHHDPLTRENHAICYEARNRNEIRHVVIDRSGKVVRELPITVKHGPSIHDCAFTGRYVVVLDLPVTFAMKALLGGQGFPYRWNPDHPARVGLLPRHGSADDIIWCDIDPCYVFHVANAYDRADGKVVLDVCAYETMFAGDAQGPSAASRGLERWVIDPEVRSVAVTTLDASPQEFPRPDERRFGQPYRYAFSVALPDDPVDEFLGANRLYRHDLEAGTRQVHDFGAGRYPGEFVFVPRSADSAEGDGWLIGLVIDMPHEKTDLVILDAMHFEDAPVAAIHLPHRVPPGFHGNWIPASSRA
jgi:carotenoid cleavage dioxygenase